MQVYVYHFHVKPGCEEAFKAAWHKLTELIYIERGSLGSRLHISSKREFIAYAQWPSFEVAKQSHLKSAEFRAAFESLTACIDSMEILHELDVIDDLLKLDIST